MPGLEDVDDDDEDDSDDDDDRIDGIEDDFAVNPGESDIDVQVCETEGKNPVCILLCPVCQSLELNSPEPGSSCSRLAPLSPEICRHSVGTRKHYHSRILRSCRLRYQMPRLLW
jgi:hypothetical protein